MILKLCPGCNEELPLEDYSPSARGRYGRAYRCRTCSATARRAHYARTADDETRAKARDAMRTRTQDPKDREATRARNAEWAKKNAQKVNARNRRWRRRNPDRNREIQAAYRSRNPDVGSAHVQRRRAWKLQAPVNDFTAAEWRELLKEFGNGCAYCLKTGVQLQQEHMTPLSRGGSHTRSNIVPACAGCNGRKGTRDLIEFLESETRLTCPI